MAWDKNEPTGDGDFSLRDDAIRANFAAIETCIGETNLSDGETLFDTSDGHDHDGTNSKKVTGQLGDWVSKTQDTVYQATTDGSVVAYAVAASTAQREFAILTDSSNPPTTKRQSCTLATDTAANGSMRCPVKKNDYWKASRVNSSGAITVYWIPLGS